MANEYGWKCPWCPTSFSGPYRESVEREREHRVSCQARPAMSGDRPAAPKLGPKTESKKEPDLFLPADKKFVGCNAPGHCSLRHYWGTIGYKGEVCCVPKPCPELRESLAMVANQIKGPLPCHDADYYRLKKGHLGWQSYFSAGR